jgi:hypothetical protein
MNHVSAQEPGLAGSPAQMDRWTRQLRVLAALALPLMLAFLISACDTGGGGSSATPTTAAAARVHVTTTPAPNRIVPDPVEKAETTAAKTLPSFATAAGPAIQALYQGAMDHPDAYSVIPCYCGCAMYQHAHMILMNCFFTSTAADGSITWTDHSMNCDICTGIAEMTVAGVQANTPLVQLRQAVHDKFKYTNVWTDTPPIQ